MIKPLQLYETYNRKMVHDIFDPFSSFYSGTGTWGGQGIVKIPNQSKDYVFLLPLSESRVNINLKRKLRRTEF